MSACAFNGRWPHGRSRQITIEKRPRCERFPHLARIAISATMLFKNSLQRWGTESKLHQQQQKQCANNLAVAGHIRYGNPMTASVMASNSLP
jgi:hypothetical protein